MVSDAWEDIIEDNEELIESIEDLTGYSLEQTDSNNETETAEKTYSLLEAMHDLKFMKFVLFLVGVFSIFCLLATLTIHSLMH